jgi:nucleoside-diphosphate-sugar epimerase
MKVLIIGGTGVLSNEVVNYCLNNNFETFILNRGKRKNLIPNNVKLFCADNDNVEMIRKLLWGYYFDTVIDFLCYTEKQIEQSINIYKDFCNQFIFISSATVYKPSNNICFEDSPLINPFWKYSADKVSSEKKLISICSKNNINYCIIRPGVTYGNTRIPYGIMPAYGYHWTLISRILNNKPIITWNNGQNISAITRVEDFSNGVVGLIGNKLAFNKIFNIVGDSYYKWIEVISTLEDILNKKAILFNIPVYKYAGEIPNRKGELIGGRSIDFRYDNSKIKNVVPSFKNTISLKDGLSKTIEYHRKNNFLGGIDYSFDANCDRIISKYSNHTNKYYLSFNDYLNENKRLNKYRYIISRHKKNYLIRSLIIIIKVIRKSYRYIPH